LRRRRLLLTAGACVFTAILFALTHSIWLGWLGGALVSASMPAKAEAALVLAGDPRGNRIKTAGELVRAGYVSKVFVSGPVAWYGINEADLAIQFAVNNGYPREWFEALKIDALSTDEEARAVIPEIEKRGIGSLLIVTSNFHTARAGKIYRRLVPSRIELRTIAAPDPYFGPHGWWRTREGCKTWFYETTKTVTEWVGI